MYIAKYAALGAIQKRLPQNSGIFNHPAPVYLLSTLATPPPVDVHITSSHWHTSTSTASFI